MNLKNKSQRIVVVISLATVVCFSNVESVSAIGLALPLPLPPVVKISPSSQHDFKVQIARVIPRKKDLIIYKSSKDVFN